MALTDETKIDRIEVLESGILQVRWARRIYDDGKEITKTYHRASFTPGSDVSAQEKQIKDIAKVTWTAPVIAAYKASIAE